MYTRVPSGQIPRGMRVPENYAGNAFRPLPHEKPMASAPHVPNHNAPPLEKTSHTAPPDSLPETTFEREAQEAELSSAPEPPAASSPTSEPTVAVDAKPSALGLKLPFRLPSWGTGLSIGFEELLLLGMILLISQEGKNDDLILLLILLLFIR